MVTKATKTRYELVLFDDDHNHVDFIVNLVGGVLGYDTTQAHNCALLIHRLGQYVVSRYDGDDLLCAQNHVELFNANGIKAELRDLRPNKKLLNAE